MRKRTNVARWTPWLIATLCVGMLLGGASYAAIVRQSPIDDTGKIQACFNPASGAVKLRVTASCPTKGYTSPIAWDQHGVSSTSQFDHISCGVNMETRYDASAGTIKCETMPTVTVVAAHGAVTGLPGTASCTTTCTASVPFGTTVHLKAVSGDCAGQCGANSSIFNGWVVYPYQLTSQCADRAVPYFKAGEHAESPCEITVNADTTFTANFALAGHVHIDVDQTGSGAGTMVIKAGEISPLGIAGFGGTPTVVDCGTDATSCDFYAASQVYQVGDNLNPVGLDSVHIGAAGLGAHSIIRACSTVSDTPSCQTSTSWIPLFNGVKGERTGTVRFDAGAHRLAAAIGGGPGFNTIDSNDARIGCVQMLTSFGGTSGLCAALYDDGSTVTLNNHSAGGLNFFRWFGACSGTSVGNACVLTMDDDKSAWAGP